MPKSRSNRRKESPAASDDALAQLAEVEKALPGRKVTGGKSGRMPPPLSPQELQREKRARRSFELRCLAGGLRELRRQIEDFLELSAATGKRLAAKPPPPSQERLSLIERMEAARTGLVGLLTSVVERAEALRSERFPHIPIRFGWTTKEPYPAAPDPPAKDWYDDVERRMNGLREAVFKADEGPLDAETAKRLRAAVGQLDGDLRLLRQRGIAPGRPLIVKRPPPATPRADLTADAAANADEGGRGGANDATSTSIKKPKKPRMKWQEAQEKLLGMIERGERYSSMQECATEVGCAKSTVYTAIKNSERLRAWQGKGRGRGRAPTAQSLNEVVQDRALGNEPDPAEVAEENDYLDNVFPRLLDEATEEERAELNSKSLAEQRELAREKLAQERDQAIENSGPERNDPAYQNPKRRGNRLLGRKP